MFWRRSSWLHHEVLVGCGVVEDVPDVGGDAGAPFVDGFEGGLFGLFSGEPDAAGEVAGDAAVVDDEFLGCPVAPEEVSALDECLEVYFVRHVKHFEASRVVLRHDTPYFELVVDQHHHQGELCCADATWCFFGVHIAYVVSASSMLYTDECFCVANTTQYCLVLYNWV